MHWFAPSAAALMGVSTALACGSDQGPSEAKDAGTPASNLIGVDDAGASPDVMTDAGIEFVIASQALALKAHSRAKKMVKPARAGKNAWAAFACRLVRTVASVRQSACCTPMLWLATSNRTAVTQ